jgi:L-fucose isomerase-like protein
MHIQVVGASRPQFDREQAQAVLRQVADAVRALGHESPAEPLMLTEWDIDRQLTPELVRKWHEADLVVVVIATFVGADMIVKIIKGMEDKVVLWAVPEPSVGLGRLQLNSLCGAIITNNALKLLGQRIPVIYADPKSDEGRRELSSQIRVIRTVQALASTVLGVIGQRPSGYYPSDYDELQLLSQLGIRVKRIPLERAFDYGRQVPEEAGRVGVVEAQHLLVGSDTVDPQQMVQSVRAELGLRNLMRDEKLQALCVECWPQYMVDYGGAVCWANSRLIDDGSMAGCEADVHGTITMLIQKHLSGASPFFGDLVHLAHDDRLVFWHCGAAPLSLAGETQRASVHPNRKVGLTVDFALKAGSVTVLRLHRNASGQYLLMAIPGEALDDALYFSGNTVAVRPHTEAKRVLAELLSDGAEHHFAVGYGVELGDLERLAERLNLPLKVY